jgi:murein DD-endopeptidase MepM/ murein hydrolase activator NlpD
MMSKKHKRKRNHMILITSDATDGKTRLFRLNSHWFQVVICFICVLVGTASGYLYYESRQWQSYDDNHVIIEELQLQVKELTELSEQQNKNWESQQAAYENKILVLSETVNQKTEVEEELRQSIAKESTPTEFPLTGSASIQEGTEGEPICMFTATKGTTVVATAKGTVTAVNDDAEYGHNVWVDHGNGYLTIYRNQGEPVVEAGDPVAQGTTLFLIGDDNTKLGYQMMKDGSYINPMELLTIYG